MRKNGVNNMTPIQTPHPAVGCQTFKFCIFQSTTNHQRATFHRNRQHTQSNFNNAHNSSHLSLTNPNPHANQPSQQTSAGQTLLSSQPFQMSQTCKWSVRYEIFQITLVSCGMQVGFPINNITDSVVLLVIRYGIRSVIRITIRHRISHIINNIIRHKISIGIGHGMRHIDLQLPLCTHVFSNLP